MAPCIHTAAECFNARGWYMFVMDHSTPPSALPRFSVMKEQDFAAAHFLRQYHGGCEQLHGHNYIVRLHMGCDELDSDGMVADFCRLRDVLREVLGRFDHKLINDVPPFDALNPTVEHLARYIAEECAAQLDDARVRVTSCEIWETARNCAMYRR
jgi:6-pyruvoyltetrahydropterin/6-carboxytetrahydropterin synthase